MGHPGKRLRDPSAAGQVTGPGVQKPPDGRGPTTPRPETAAASLPAGIEATPGVCGGDARIAGTRIPVWSLALARRLGGDRRPASRRVPIPTLCDLAHAWSYAERTRTRSTG